MHQGDIGEPTIPLKTFILFTEATGVSQANVFACTA